MTYLSPEPDCHNHLITEDSEPRRGGGILMTVKLLTFGVCGDRYRCAWASVDKDVVDQVFVTLLNDGLKLERDSAQIPDNVDICMRCLHWKRKRHGARARGGLKISLSAVVLHTWVVGNINKVAYNPVLDCGLLWRLPWSIPCNLFVFGLAASEAPSFSDWQPVKLH
jgi:hypothetical protein